MAQAPAIVAELEEALASEPSPPDISVVVTIFNEVETLDDLALRLRTALDAFGRPWEVVFVDDGSSDGSRERLRKVHETDRRMRVVLLKRNVGQHPAMAAGMRASRAD
ncbi:MAG: glycosyltransferase, partial [Gaiellales bacterium]